jgi:hypothetical protein
MNEEVIKDQRKSLIENSVYYNKIEGKNRKYWLFSSFCVFLFLPINWLFIAIASSEGIKSSDLYSSLGCGIFVLIAVQVSIQLYAIWYCAYKKHGTKLLTCLLVLLPISRFAAWSVIPREPLIIVVTLIDVVICAWWFVLSLRIRKINKKIQTIRILS